MLLVMLAVVGIQAQVKTMADLSNAKAYTITSQRCFLQTITGGTQLYTSTGTAEGVVTEANAQDPNQQFALLKGDADYYLYSVGAQQFVSSDGSLLAAPNASTVVTIVENGNATNPFTFKFGSNYLNTQDANQNAAGYLIDSWSTLDAGNQFAIVEAAEPDLAAAISAIDGYEHNSITATVNYSLCYNGTVVSTYTKEVKGGAPLTVTFDAPATYLGATCQNEQRASEVINEAKTIDVTYNYTLNAEELPIVPATITDGKFAAGTKWYYMNPTKQTTYAYYSAQANSGNGGFLVEKNVTSAPAKEQYFFTFVGNPVAGYQIYNYAAGAEKSAFTDASEPYDVTMASEGVTFLLETGTSTGQYRFHFDDYDETGLAYLDAYYSPMYMYGWSYASGWSSYAPTDADAQIYINEVSADIIALATGGQMSVTSVSPEAGNIIGGLSEINVLFDQPINRVYGFDHDGAGVEGEDEPKSIALCSKEGLVVQEFKYEDEAYGYEIDETNPNQLNIYFERPFTTTGSYTLVVPMGLVYSDKGLTNAEQTVVYDVKENFTATTVTGRVYNAAFDSFSGSAWPASLLPYDETLGYYEIKVQVNTKDEVVFQDYTGKSGESLKINFDPTDGSIQLVNGEEADGYGSYWADSNVLDGNYSGYYLYYSPSYCNINFDEEVGHGTAALNGYEYASWTPYYMFIEWYMDDRFASADQTIAMESITPAAGKVESLSNFTINFAKELTEVRNSVEVTLTNSVGTAVGGTITATLNADNKKQINIALSEAVTADGVYTLTVPTGLGAREAEDGAGYTEKLELTYQIGELQEDVLTWSHKGYDCLFEGWIGELFPEGGKFDNIQVDYYNLSRRLILNNWMGDENHDLTLNLAADQDSILTFNGEKLDSYGSVAVFTGNADYYFAYLYPDYCYVSSSETKGYVALSGYFYKDPDDDGSWCYYGIYWTTDDDGVTTVKSSIQPAETVYNLAGVKMNANKLKAGIYVKNGRKIVIK